MGLDLLYYHLVVEAAYLLLWVAIALVDYFLGNYFFGLLGHLSMMQILHYSDGYTVLVPVVNNSY